MYGNLKSPFYKNFVKKRLWQQKFLKVKFKKVYFEFIYILCKAQIIMLLKIQLPIYNNFIKISNLIIWIDSISFMENLLYYASPI